MSRKRAMLALVCFVAATFLAVGCSKKESSEAPPKPKSKSRPGPAPVATEPVVYFLEHVIDTRFGTLEQIPAVQRLTLTGSEAAKSTVVWKDPRLSFVYGLGPSLPKDQEVMAVASWQGPDKLQLCIGTCTLDGKGWAPISPPTENRVDHSPLFSPDGKYIAFLRSAGQPNGAPLGGTLCIYRLAEKVVREYCQAEPLSSQAWSPDSARLVFCRPDSPGLWMLRMPAGQLKQLVDAERSGEPAWGPEGTSVAFVSKGTRIPLPPALRSGLRGGDICTVDPTSGKVIRLAKGWLHMPLWSPDGRKIAYFRAYVSAEPADTSKQDPGGKDAANEIQIMDDCEIISVSLRTRIARIPVGFCMYRRPAVWLPPGRSLILAGEALKERPAELELKLGEAVEVRNPLGFTGDLLLISPGAQPPCKRLRRTQTFDGAGMACRSRPSSVWRKPEAEQSSAP